MDNDRRCETLILLVGSNPLPNYITARILQPNTIVLVYTRETELVMKHLMNVFVELSYKVISCPVVGTDPRSIRNGISKQISANSHLNYTGGTKVMAAHARRAFQESEGSDSQASYLDEREGCLRFDDGYPIALAGRDLELSLNRITELHGITVITDNNIEEPTQKDAQLILSHALAKPELPRILYDEGQRLLKRGITKAQQEPFEINHIIPEMPVNSIPENGWNKKKMKIWCEFLKGTWLEICVAEWVRDITRCETSQGIHCYLPSGRELEVDVTMVRGHRFYLVSCTTDNKLDLCKSKLFEVALRAKQLGGDLARASLVCLLDGSDHNGLYIDQLAQDVESIWEAPNKPRVFGAAHLREWYGINGAPNLESFIQWLDS